MKAIPLSSSIIRILKRIVMRPKAYSFPLTCAVSNTYHKLSDTTLEEVPL